MVPIDWNYFSALLFVFFPSCVLFCTTAYLFIENWAREDREKRETVRRRILGFAGSRLAIFRPRGDHFEPVMFFDDYFTLPYRPGSQWRIA